jgi:hypothetical protein
VPELDFSSQDGFELADQGSKFTGTRSSDISAQDQRLKGVYARSADIRRTWIVMLTTDFLRAAPGARLLDRNPHD